MNQKHYEPGIYVVLDGDIEYVDAFDGKWWRRWNMTKSRFPVGQVIAGPMTIEQIKNAAGGQEESYG